MDDAPFMVSWHIVTRGNDMSKKITSRLLLSGFILSAVSGCATTAEAKRGSNAAPQSITAEEKAQGDGIHPQILQEFGGAWDSAQTPYVVSVGKNIALQSGLGNAEKDFTVTLLNSPVNNAFAIPGGYIYITRQLTALCNSEAEMAGVLGHEVGHVAARHSKKRQSRARRNGILGILGQVAGGLLGDNGGLAGLFGGLAQQYSGPLANILTLGYSRKQEEEADDLGVQYLSKAGYDPTALSDMLLSLSLATNVDAKAAGRDVQAVPAWASTHPEPAKRVRRALAEGRNFAASDVRRTDRHMAAIDGMLYGDDPAQGIVDGLNFVHPDLRFKFSAPAGFNLQNGTTAVQINGSTGRGFFTTLAYSGNRTNYIDAAFKAVAGEGQTIEYGSITSSTVNGIPAFSASANVAGQNGNIEVTVFAYEFSKTQAFHFVTTAPVNTRPFANMYQSVSRIGKAEADQVKPRRLRVITVQRGDTIESLAARMSYDTLKVERFMALNGMASARSLQPGTKMKIVTY